MSERSAGISAGIIDASTQRVLIVCPSWIGDTIMATPVYRAVRAALPGAKLIGLVRPGLEQVLDGTPWFDELIVERGAGVFGPLAVSRAVRDAKPQAALLLPNSVRSALGVWLARVPVRIGYARDGRGPLLTHRATVRKAAAPESTVAYYAHLAQFALGVESIDERLELAPSQTQREAAERVLPSSEVRSPLIVLNPGANRADKRWPAERFAAVGDALIDSHEATIAVTGSPAERDVVERVCASSRAEQRFINLIDRGVTLSALKAIIERAELLITNDTGPRHIAIALGTPAVSLFGPTDYRWTRIEDAREHCLIAEPFLLEELIADQHPGACAIDRIATSDVIHAARRMLDAGTTGSRVKSHERGLSVTPQPGAS